MRLLNDRLASGQVTFNLISSSRDLFTWWEWSWFEHMVDNNHMMGKIIKRKRCVTLSNSWNLHLWSQFFVLDQNNSCVFLNFFWGCWSQCYDHLPTKFIVLSKKKKFQSSLLRSKICVFPHTFFVYWFEKNSVNHLNLRIKSTIKGFEMIRNHFVNQDFNVLIN